MGFWSQAIAMQKSLTGAIRAPFSKQYPGGYPLASNRTNALTLGPDRVAIFDNTYQQLWANAAGTDVVTGCSVDGSNNFLLSGEQYVPMYQHFKFNMNATAGIVTQHFFIVPTASRLVGITEIHSTAESTAATLTAYVEKLTSTTAPGSGSTVMSGTFNLKSTANTLQTATLYSSATGDSSDPRVQFAAGDRVGVVVSAAGTEIAGVVITVTFAPLDGTKWVTWNMNANGSLADQAFFLANRPYIVQSAYYVHSTKGSHGSAVNLQITKDTSTNAPGAGTDLLTNNTNAGFNCKGDNNTVQTGTLTATAASLRLAPGDRLAVDFAGTLTALAGVIVVVVLQATERRKEVTFALAANGSLADQAFWTADRNYRIDTITEVHSTAGSDGSAVNMQVTIDKATEAPGAGVDLLSNNTNAGFDMKGTANTVQVGTFVDTRYNYIMAGERLSVDFAGTLTALAGVVVTVSLTPA